MIEEPELSAGLVRLYRIGNLPKESHLYGITPESPEFAQLGWLDQEVITKGISGAWGRWFTHDQSSVNWYGENENWGCPLHYVYVSPEQAESWLVGKNPEARKFSSDPDIEYFLPIDVANSAQPMPGYVPPRNPDGSRTQTAPEARRPCATLPKPGQLQPANT